MNIAKVQTVRKIVLAAMITIIVLLFCITSSKHVSGDPVHEAIEMAGIALMLICIVGRTWSSLYIGGRKITELVTTGPYSMVRNPLYFFSVLGAAGAGAQLGSLWSAVAVGFLVWAVFYVVVLREEQLMANIYGREFEDYKRRVWRFVPRPWLWRDTPVLSVMPSRAVRTFADGLWILLAIPAAEAIERLQEINVLPVLFRLG